MNVFKLFLLTSIMGADAIAGWKPIHNCSDQSVTRNDEQEEYCDKASKEDDHEFDAPNGITYSHKKPFVVGGKDVTCGEDKPLGSKGCK